MSLRRRTPAALLAAGLLAGASPAALACEARTPTRATGPGPHDYSAGVADNKLWREGDAGEPLFIRARVLDTCGEPVAGARIQILHANQDGAHEPDRWRADLTSDERGAFQLVTVNPGYTGGIPRHIHFVITHPRHRQLVTRLFFKDDPSIDGTTEELAMVLEEVPRGDATGWVAGYEFVLEPQ